MMAATKMTHDERQRPVPSGPRRTCAGCSEESSVAELVRVVIDEAALDGEDRGAALAVDLSDSKFGRGAHVHPSRDCLTKALRTGFSRAFKTKVAANIEDISGQIVSAADRRIEGLLSGARRARHAVSGTDTVREALRDESAHLVVVATDAAAAIKAPEVERAIAEGAAIAWGSKQTLGALFGRDEVAVCAVLHEGVAVAMASAYRMSRPFVDGSRSEAWSCPEVR